jgi:GDP-L-fucose synthase
MRHVKVFVAGHRGLVGSALVRALRARGSSESAIVTRTHAELDLRDQDAVLQYLRAERPQHVYLAAARVGGIHANNTYPADFILDNLAIQTNVIEASRQAGVQRLLFLGSSCIYPKLAAQPLHESALLSGPLEPTNRPYAIAKIAGIEMCWAYNRQYRTSFLSAMPTNLYGLRDNYHPDNSHVIPALIRRFHEAKENAVPEVVIWGTGKPRREFMFADDMADACVHLMNLPDAQFQPLLAADRNDGMPPMINVGVGEDLTIAELAGLVRDTVGYSGRIRFDATKPDGTPRKLLDVSRLSALGWRPKTSLREGLRLAYEDFQARVLQGA